MEKNKKLIFRLLTNAEIVMDLEQNQGQNLFLAQHVEDTAK